MKRKRENRERERPDMPERCPAKIKSVKVATMSEKYAENMCMKTHLIE